MSLERIDKIVASQLNLTRNEVKKLIKSKLVRVNGQVVCSPKDKFETIGINVDVCGDKIEYKEHIYIMLNKPKGIVSATKDDNVKTVIDLVPENIKRSGLFPAGRLDGDTTGFVLITDDGDFAHKILSPKNHIIKTYVATLAENITKDDIYEIENGIKLKDGTKCLNADLKVLQTSPKTIVQIRICEGKYHQVKRMFSATGNKVVELKRIKMGNLKLDDDLKSGECRELTDEEIQKIQKRT